MGHYWKTRTVSLAEQAFALKIKYPDFQVFLDRVTMKVKGSLRPTSRSETYRFSITYGLIWPPITRIISPELFINFKGEKIPHRYSDNSLCLYQPKYGEFTRSTYISETIVPWTSLWLYYYEVWHTTGNWLGGGEHPIN
jgi:hypothetical protein